MSNIFSHQDCRGALFHRVPGVQKCPPPTRIRFRHSIIKILETAIVRVSGCLNLLYMKWKLFAKYFFVKKPTPTSLHLSKKLNFCFIPIICIIMHTIVLFILLGYIFSLYLYYLYYIYITFIFILS